MVEGAGKSATILQGRLRSRYAERITGLQKCIRPVSSVCI